MKLMDVSDEVWMWVHQKYEISRIIQTIYAFKANNWSHLAVPDILGLNQQNIESYDL